MNRITSETSSDTQIDYTYDDQGNRSSLESTGNLPQMPGEESFAYNAINQLSCYQLKTEQSETNATYTYYGDGLRATKTVNGELTRFIHLKGQVIEELDATGAVKARNIWGNELLYREDQENEQSGYYRYNGHGDVIAMDDAQGQVLNEYEYDIWGNITSQSEQMPNPFRYSGEYYDEESGLYNLRARMYDPKMGRFLNEDTYLGELTNPLSLNLYAYVLNNPLRYIDPSGHVEKETGEGGGLYLQPGPTYNGGSGSSSSGGGGVKLPAQVRPGAPGQKISIPKSSIKSAPSSSGNTTSKSSTTTTTTTVAPSSSPTKIQAQVTEQGVVETKQTYKQYLESNAAKNDKTKHGEQRALQRGFTEDKINTIKDNYSQKLYQSGGKTVYAKKSGNYYDVVITNRKGEVVTTVGGNTKSLKSWSDVTKMLNNNGGYSTLPLD